MSTMQRQTTNYEVVLMEYAAGTLDLAQRLVVTAHLSLSPRARSIVRDCECLGGAMLEKQCDPVAMNGGSLENVLARIERQELPPAPRPRHAALPEDARLPACFEQYIVCRPSARLQWRTVYPGIDLFALPLECRRSRAQMMRLRPGIAAPRHRHAGLELTLILDGAFMDESGIYEPGTLIVADADDPAHTPRSCEKRGGVCITVTPAAHGAAALMARLLRPFSGF